MNIQKDYGAREREHILNSKLEENKYINHAMIYQHAYVVWYIIAIHGHQGYFGQRPDKIPLSYILIKTISNKGKLEILGG